MKIAILTIVVLLLLPLMIPLIAVAPLFMPHVWNKAKTQGF